MAEVALTLRLRRALSYRERARQLERESDAAREAGRISPERANALREFYNGHVRAAASEVEECRAQLRIVQDRHMAGLRAIEARLASVSLAATQGALRIGKANKLSRKLSAQAESIRDQVKTMERLIAAQQSKEVGGFVDLPIDEYLAGQKIVSMPLMRVERAILVALPILLACSVLVPWFEAQGAARPLYQVRFLLRDFGIAERTGKIPLEIVWFPFFALPLCVFPFAAVDDKRLGGYGISAVGLLLIAAVVGACLFLPLLASSGAQGPIELMRRLEIGPYLYLGGAILLVALGRRRSLERLTFSRRSTALLAGLAAAVALVLALSFLSPLLPFGRSAVSVRFSPDQAHAGRYRVAVENHGGDPLRVVLSPPEGTAQIDESGNHAQFIVLTLYVRERGSDTFRLLSRSGEWWKLHARTEEGALAFEVEPGLSAEVTLDTQLMLREGIDLDAFQIVCARATGEVVARLEKAFNSVSSVSNNVPQVVPITHSDLQPNAIQQFTPRPEPQKETPLAEPTQPELPEAAAAAPPLPQARVAGIMGDKAKIRLSVGEAAQPDEELFSVGDSVLDAWVVGEILPGKRRVVLLNTETGTRLELTLGDWAPLQP